MAVEEEKTKDFGTESLSNQRRKTNVLAPQSEM